MIRNIVIFLVTFAVGAVVALATRAALHEPHSEATATAVADHSSMVDNALVPAEPATSDTKASIAGEASDHSAHAANATKSAASSPAPVNSVCAICGMEVDPKLPTAEYQGKTIGFGCRMCRPKFEANPDKYGPAYLRNEVIGN